MWTTVFVAPLYNLLLIIMGWFDGNLAIAIVAVTILIKVILSPFTYRALRAQIIQKNLAPKMNEIRKKYTDKMEQTQKILELYREHNAHPLSGCLPVIVQIPVIFALYQVFLKGIEPNLHLAYSPDIIPPQFITNLLSIDLLIPSILFAILAGLSQWIQLHYSIANQQPITPAESDQEKITQSFQKSMQFTLPIIIAGVGFAIPAAVALYWIVSNIITLTQEKILYSLVNKA